MRSWQSALVPKKHLERYYRTALGSGLEAPLFPGEGAMIGGEPLEKMFDGKGI